MSNQYHSQIVILPVGCVVLEMWQLISEKLLEVKCLVFSEDHCENNEKFYLKLCIKYYIPYAGSMRCLICHISCGHSVEFCLFSFVAIFKVLHQKFKIFRNEKGIVGMCVAKLMMYGISWEIQQMICAIWAHDLKPQNYVLFSSFAIFWNICFWLKCIVYAAVSLLLWMCPCCLSL